METINEELEENNKDDMGIFTLDIGKEKFQYTNRLWNSLGLNLPSRIGYISRIIFDRDFKDKDDWKTYYTQSGRNRLERIKKLPKEHRRILIEGKNIEAIKGLPYKSKTLAYNYGRTSKEIDFIIKELFEAVEAEGNPLGISYDEVKYSVYYRIIAETWNGIIVQERKTIEQLEKKYPDFQFKKTDGVDDVKYAVDFEVYFEGVLICGIQVKPTTYLIAKSIEVEETKILNKEKNLLYRDKREVPVIYIYSSKAGEVESIGVNTNDKLSIMAKALFLGA